MQKVKNLFCENRGRKLAVLLLGAFGYALLTALCSQIEQFGATAWSRTLARFAAAFPIAFVVLAALLAIAMPKLMCRPRESQKPFCTWGAALLFFGIAFAGVIVCLIFRADRHIWALEDWHKTRL